MKIIQDCAIIVKEIRSHFSLDFRFLHLLYPSNREGKREHLKIMATRDIELGPSSLSKLMIRGVRAFSPRSR